MTLRRSNPGDLLISARPQVRGREVFAMERYQDLEGTAVGLINAVIN
jgi:hypothetical protein